MLKERIYPIGTGGRSVHLVPTKQHPTWRVHGGSVYQYDSVRTGFLSQAKIPDLLKVCTPDTYDITHHDSIGKDLTLEAVLVECVINKEKYIGTIDVDIPFSESADLLEIKGILKPPDGFTIDFIGKDPEIGGLVLKELKLYLSYNTKTREFQFYNTHVGCISVVGVALGIYLINKTKDS